MHVLKRRKYYSAARFCLLIFLIVTAACTAARNRNQPKPLRYEIAPKTSRGDIITQCTIALHGYNFNIEYANSLYNHAALRTQWRVGTDIPLISGKEEDAVRLRDRATLHLSPRGNQSNRPTTLVASSLQFEMEEVDLQKKEWVTVTPDSIFCSQYEGIVSDLKGRLRRKGYIFN